MQHGKDINFNLSGTSVTASQCQSQNESGLHDNNGLAIVREDLIISVQPSQICTAIHVHYRFCGADIAKMLQQAPRL